MVDTRYVFWNWKVVTNDSRWLEWFDEVVGNFYTVPRPDTWLHGYRVTARGFPVVEAVVEAAGKVLAYVGYGAGGGGGGDG